jgi:preprotein translocase subunit SecG
MTSEQWRAILSTLSLVLLSIPPIFAMLHRRVVSVALLMSMCRISIVSTLTAWGIARSIAQQTLATRRVMNKNSTYAALTAIATVAFIGLALVLAFIVNANDKGSTVEVSLLQGTPVHVATDKQCDSMYHAEYIARHTPAHAGIVDAIILASCPW